MLSADSFSYYKAKSDPRWPAQKTVQRCYICPPKIYLFTIITLAAQIVTKMSTLSGHLQAIKTAKA